MKSTALFSVRSFFSVLAGFLKPRYKALYGFHGGLYLADHKAQSKDKPIKSAENIRPPTCIILPLGVHSNHGIKPLVAIGDIVQKGQKIADGTSPYAIAIHAPLTARVTAIELKPIPHASGLQDLCLVLTPLLTPSPTDDQTTVFMPPLSLANNTSDLLQRIREAGIAGLGGAGFSSHAKLAPSTIHTVIINAVECEPYITADDSLMRAYADEIVQGIALVRKITGAAQVLVGIEDNKPEAIASLKRALTATLTSTEDSANTLNTNALRIIPSKYPSGGEKQLIENLTGQHVPQGKYAADIGIVCTNIATVYAIYQAIYLGRPLISRIITLTGEHIKPEHQGNYEVLIGTPMRDVFALGEVELGGASLPQPARFIMGGSMMGLTLSPASIDDNMPVIKTTNCLIAGSATEFPEPPPEQDCIRCGYCAEVCPVSLLPQQLLWHCQHDELDKAQQYDLAECIECGACTEVCPSHIPLVAYYQYGKSVLRIKAHTQIQAQQARQRFEFRNQRLADAEQAKNKRRQERLAQRQQHNNMPSSPALATADLKAQVEEYKQALLAVSLDDRLTTEQKQRKKAQAEEQLFAAREAVRHTNAQQKKHQPNSLSAQQSAVVDKATEAKKLSRFIAENTDDSGKDCEQEKIQLAQLNAAIAQETAQLKKERVSRQIPNTTTDNTAEVLLKRAKMQAAQAQKLHKQAHKALLAAEKSQSPRLVELSQHVNVLKAEADKHVVKLQQLQAKADTADNQKMNGTPATSTPTTTSPSPSPQMQIQMALLRTQIKRKKNDLLQASPQQIAELNSEITQLEQRLTQLSSSALSTSAADSAFSGDKK